MRDKLVRRKRRIFAIGNWVNQRLLKPVHDWLMSLLRNIPMDDTFSQTRPLSLLSGEKEPPPGSSMIKHWARSISIPCLPALVHSY